MLVYVLLFFVLCLVYDGECIVMFSVMMDLCGNGGDLNGVVLISNLILVGFIRKWFLLWKYV